MLNRSTQDTDNSSVPPEMPMSGSPASSETSRRPVRSEFARIGPVFAVRRAATIVIALAVLGGALYVALGLGGHGQPQDVPVVKAEGAYKQKPDEPGGLDIPHQDVQVYQKLDQQSGGSPQTEHLLDQAETPQAQLLPSGQVSTEPSGTSVQESPVAAPTPSTESESVLAAGSSGTLSAVASQAPVATPSLPMPSSAVGSPAASELSETASPSAATPKSAPVPPVSAHVPALPAASGSIASPQKEPSVSPQNSTAPPATNDKPDTTVAAIAKSLATTPPLQAKSQPSIRSASPVASGGRSGAVQLASFPDRAVADHMLDKMQAKYGAYLGGAKLHVVSADLGPKGVYHRIQSQQMAESKAKDICAALKNLKAGCLVVRP